MNKKLMLLAISLFSVTAFGFQKPVTIREQGSFMAGGTVVTAPETASAAAIARLMVFFIS